MKSLKKSIIRSFKSSTGRFFSIFMLMMIGSFALVGLKVTGPNMVTTGENYFNQTNLTDVTVIGSMGIDRDDVKQINKVSGISQIEYGYLKDVSIDDSNSSIRILSQPKEISKYIIQEGKDLKNQTDILLSKNFEDRYKIGDKISFIEKTGIDDKMVLKNHSYKLVGFVDSAEYISYANMGASQAGDGNLTGFAYVMDDNFESDYFMIARMRYEDTNNLNPFSDEYRRKIQAHTDELNDRLKDRGSHRLATIKSNIQDEIDEGQAKIDDAQSKIDDKQQKLDSAKDKLADGKDQLADADKKLKDAKGLLNSSKKTLDQKWQELQAGKAKLDAGKSSLIAAENRLNNAFGLINQGEKDLATAQNTLANKENELANGKDQLAAGLDQYEQKKAEVDSKNEQLTAAENELQQKQDQVTNLLNGISEVENNIAPLEARIDQITIDLSNPDIDDETKENLTSELVANQANLDGLKQKLNELNQTKAAMLTPEAEAQLETGKKELDNKRAELNVAYEKLDTAKADLDEKQAEIAAGEEKIEAGRANLQQKEAELNQAKADYQSGKAQYQSSVNLYTQNLNTYYQGLNNWNAAFEKLNRKEAEYQSNLDKYKTNVKELEEKEQEYQNGLKEFNEKTTEANDKIKDGEEKIKAAKELMDSIETPVYNIYNRREALGSAGYTIYRTISDIVDKLSNIFPVFLYFVAALVTLTTMTRFIDEERINSGTLKALGYQDKDIIKKFTIYGFIAGILGTLFGVILGHTLLPLIIFNAYGKHFSVPKIQLDFYPKLVVISLILSLISSVIPAFIVAKKQLNDKPTNLLLPKPPAKGSKILLEKITPIWSRMGFIQKVTARNIFRYKKRMFMTIFGVAGAATLLFAGFSVQRSIEGIETTQFGELINYDLIVAFNNQQSDDDKKQIDDLLTSQQVINHTGLHYDKVTKVAGDFNDKQEINLLVSNDVDKVNEFIILRDRKSGKTIKLPEDGVVISERLADITGTKVGDELTIQDKHDHDKTVKVAAISEMYAGHFMFMTDKNYEKAFGENYEANAEIVTLADSSLDNANKVAKQFMNIDGVKGVVSNTLIENQTNIVVTALNKIMLLIIVVATLLAMVILYNLTNINVQERIRELSTIKVLGFHNREVTMYIYRETIFLTLLGIFAGYILGDALFIYILKIVPPAEIMFNPALSWVSFAIPLGIIGIITLILGRLVFHKLKHVDMLEALKSVE